MTDPTSLSTASQILYIVGALDNHIAAIRVDGGQPPAHLPGSPFDLGRKGSFSLVNDSSRKRLYAAHLNAGHIDILDVAPDGRVRPIPISPQRTGSPAGGLAIDSDRGFLFATCVARNKGLASVRSFKVTQSGLEPNGPAVSTGGLLRDWVALPALTPDGRHLYVASYWGGRILHFRVAEDGVLSGVQQRIRCGGGPVSPTISPDGRHLYVVNEFSNTISGYVISGSGELARISATPVPTGKFPHGITFTPDGRFAYVPNLFGRSISAYSVGPDGALTELAGSPFPALSGRSGPGRAICSPDGATLYIVEIGSATSTPRAVLNSYIILPDGMLQSTGYTLDTGILFADGPSSVLLSPTDGIEVVTKACIADTGPQSPVGAT